MGLPVDILRGTYDSPANAFYGQAHLTVTNIPGPFEPTDDAPEAVLSTNSFGNPIIVPVGQPVGTVGPMMGGTFAYSSDTRFHRAVGIYGAVAIHDRFESR